MPDRKLDLNDIPEASDEQLHRARRVASLDQPRAMQSSSLQFALFHGFLRNFAAWLPNNQNPIRL